MKKHKNKQNINMLITTINFNIGNTGNQTDYIKIDEEIYFRITTIDHQTAHLYFSNGRYNIEIPDSIKLFSPLCNDYKKKFNNTFIIFYDDILEMFYNDIKIIKINPRREVDIIRLHEN